MAERIVVDPVTRIEGHLRVEVDVDASGKISEAYSSGTSVRGLEIIAKDRDPRDLWAFMQRICGVCTTTHAIASVRAVEAALDIKIPYAGHLVRQVILGTQMMHDHVVHFYHLHALDWVDVVSATTADPAETSKIAQSISNWPKSSPGYFKDVQDKVKKLIESGQLGLFAKGYWGHPAYKLPPEVNLMAVAHYLEALDWQKEIAKVHAILGGKNPHPHFLVGGMATPLDANSDNAIHIEKLMHVSQLIDDAHRFVNEVYVPDLIAIAGFYKDTASYGGGIQNFLSFGDFSPEDHNKPETYRFPRGAILDGNLSEVLEVDLEKEGEIEEYIDKAWYTYDGEHGTGVGKHPYDGETTLNYTGPEKNYKHLDVDDSYTWVKAPYWKGNPMEVGPLARMVIGYASGKEDFKAIIDDTLDKLDVPITALYSVLGRTAARGLESKLIADWTRQDMDALLAAVRNGKTATFNGEKWEPSTWPKSAKGVGFVEAPRGFLGHWIVIEDQKTANYQAVVPTTWNAAPKDASGTKIAPYEAALMGTPMADKDQPLEIIRVIHSFDPCLACAVHLTDLENKETTEIRIG